MRDQNAPPSGAETAGQPLAGQEPTAGRESTAGQQAAAGQEAAGRQEVAPDRQQAAAGPEMSQSVSAQLAPQSRIDRILALVPRALSSHAHIVFLGALGVYLVLLPLVGINVSARAELIGGNYTNVTSDLGACIAAGLTVHLVKRERRRAERFEALIHALHLRHDALERSVESAVEAAKGAEAAIRATRGGA